MSQELKFACPSCGNEYPWKPRLAGRKGKCKCGEIMRIPAEPPGSSRATKSAAVMSRPMPRPMPTATSLYEDSSVQGMQAASPNASTGAGAISPREVKDEVAPPSAPALIPATPRPPAVSVETKKPSMLGALRGLWPKSQKR